MKETRRDPQEEIDKKRVAITIGIIAILVGAFIVVRQIYSPTPRKPMPQSVKGIQNSLSRMSKNPPFQIPNAAEELQKKVEGIKTQISNINVADVASSSPQIQDIMRQIQNLPQLPSAVARDVCESLCKKL